MFGGNGRNGFTIGLVVGICLTIIFCVWLLWGNQPVNYAGTAESAGKNTEEYTDQDQNLQSWWEHDWVLVTSKDTLAQWAMAFLGLVATAVSVLAVWLLKKTLDATIIAVREGEKATFASIEAATAAAEANRIIRSDQRPWLDFEIMDFGDFQVVSGAAWSTPNVMITNLGKSPALNVWFKMSIIEAKTFDDEIERDRIVNEFGQSSLIHEGLVIFPGRSRSRENTLAGGRFIRTQDGVKQNENATVTWWFTCIVFYESGGEKFYTRKVFSCPPPDYSENTRDLKVEPRQDDFLTMFR